MTAPNLTALAITPAEWEAIKEMPLVEACGLVAGRMAVVKAESHLRTEDRIDAACRDAIARIRLYKRLGADPHWSVALMLAAAVTA